MWNLCVNIWNVDCFAHKLLIKQGVRTAHVILVVTKCVILFPLLRKENRDLRNSMIKPEEDIETNEDFKTEIRPRIVNNKPLIKVNTDKKNNDKNKEEESVNENRTDWRSSFR